MKTFESWMQDKDQDLYSEIDWRGLAQKTALAASLMSPSSGEAAPYKPTSQGRAAVQKFHDVYHMARTKPLMVNDDGSFTVSAYGKTLQEAQERAQTIFATHMTEKFAKRGLTYKKDAFIAPSDQQVDVLVSQPLPEKKGFVYQVRVKVNSYRAKPSKSAPPLPIKPIMSDVY
jgi:hypothetical protein